MRLFHSRHLLIHHICHIMKTADLCDSFISSPSRMSVCESGCLLDYGGLKSFYGMIQTVRCFESNTIVRETLSTKGNGRVLVVDGGGSKRCALLGDILAKMAHENGWSGIVINGCIRDSAIIAQLPIGIKALGVHPLKSIKRTDGEVGCPVAFAGVEFAPTYWLYADEDGVIISAEPLHPI